MKTTKKCKRLLLLWVLMVNLLPCIKDGQVTWTTMRVEAQQYIVELPENFPPGPYPPLAVACYPLSNNMGISPVSGYSDKPWCGILLLASLTNNTPEQIAEWYANYRRITVEEISGTHSEEVWYPSFGVNIGSMLTTREECEINQALFYAGPGTGLFITISNPGHVYVIYELTYDPLAGNGACRKYDTADSQRDRTILWDDITSITGNMYLISK